ncbi:TPA: IS30 family transposase [Candidatus Acetothermia bacterium]|nr:IS30 family transposase [Candidatus Acetothermia bacterium]
MLGRHKSTISREVSRNRGMRGYRPRQAHRLALERRKAKMRPRFGGSMWTKVELLLQMDWSPQQISGRLMAEEGIRISHEHIYQYIYADKRAGGDLYRHLRCKKKRRKRYGSYDRRGVIRNRVSIDERPEVVGERSRVGDWEGDTVIGKNHKGALVTLVERKSLYTLIGAVACKTAAAVGAAIVAGLTPHKDRVHTLTYDNGKELAEHEQIAKALGVDIYFAHPYSSWERGVNENTNGLIRQYFPKGRELTAISKEEIAHATDRLNHRPRKTLGFRSPYEVFFSIKTPLTVALGS